jgi:5'-3' exonuclease
MRTGDNNPGIKIIATKTILDLVEKYPHLTPLCLKERMIRNLKDAKSRIELVTIVTTKSLVPRWHQDDSYYRKDIMNFITSYLKKHPHADVRKAAFDLLVIISQHQDFKVISTFLENDTIKSLQQVKHSFCVF